MERSLKSIRSYPDERDVYLSVLEDNCDGDDLHQCKEEHLSSKQIQAEMMEQVALRTAVLSFFAAVEYAFAKKMFLYEAILKGGPLVAPTSKFKGFRQLKKRLEEQRLAVEITDSNDWKDLCNVQGLRDCFAHRGGILLKGNEDDWSLQDKFAESFGVAFEPLGSDDVVIVRLRDSAVRHFFTLGKWFIRTLGQCLERKIPAC